jgi:hypothetical protein
MQSGQPLFSEYVNNPVFAPGRAYYPTVIYDSAHFGDTYAGGLPYYKMWYTSAAGIAVAYSSDGVTWNQYGACGGLLASSHHAHVIYDSNGFGGTAIHYKMWFWDWSASIYSLAALKYAESSDGINWVWQSLTQDATYPLVTGVSPDWNRGTYGPVDVFYNPGGSLTLDDITLWNNAYVMYYDTTTGGIEQVGLAYSANGVHWKRYGSQPVLPITPGAWDSSYAGFGTVVRLFNGYHFFYSGGQTAMHQGIGYASSPDGIVWQKASSPIFHINNSVAWRSVRCYTPSVVALPEAGRVYLHMWFTGDDGSSRAIGYAVGIVMLPVEGAELSRKAEQEIQQQMSSLARFNTARCCEENDIIVTSLLDALEPRDTSLPEYQKALQLIEEAQYYCWKSAQLISSGNTVAGNYCALQACTLYENAVNILAELADVEEYTVTIG